MALRSTDAPQRATRLAPFAATDASAGRRAVAVSLSSETPIQCDGYIEILDHSAGAVLLDRAAPGLPLLIGHDAARPVGVVENVRLDGRRLVGDALFGQSAAASDAWADVAAGASRFLSVGYEILETREEPNGVRRVTRWRPYELSIVAIAADPTIGVGRAHSGDLTMTTPNPATTPATVAPAPQLATRAPAPNNAERERSRAADIISAGAALAATIPDAPRMAERAVREGASVIEFRSALLDLLGDNAPGRMNAASAPDWGRDARRVANYSLGAAVAAAVSGDWRAAGMEREVSNELASRAGKSPRGFYVPAEALATRAVDTGVGASMVSTVTEAGAFIDSLREQSVVLRLGARPLGGLVGKVTIPKLGQNTVAQWVGEGVAPAASDPTFGGVDLEPHTLAGHVIYTRRMALSTNVGIEDILRRDLREQIARGLDAAALMGGATADAPGGIVGMAGVGSVEHGPNGGPLTWVSVVSFLEQLEAANAATGRLGWAVSPGVKAFALSTPKVSGDAMMMMADPENLMGYPVIATPFMQGIDKGTGTNLKGAIFGNWADLIVAQWGGIDLLVDPYSFSSSGNVRIAAFADLDFRVRHAESFVVSTDIA